MNEQLPNDASYAIVEQQEDEQDEDETDYEEENTYDLQDNFWLLLLILEYVDQRDYWNFIVLLLLLTNK